VDGCSLIASHSVLGRNGARKTFPKQLRTPRSRILLEKLTDPQAVKKFREFYGTRRFITAFTRAHQLSLFSARSIKSMSYHPISWR